MTDAGLKELITDIDAHRIERARRMTPEAKFDAGYELYRRACTWMEAGIRNDFPNADDAEIRRIMRERWAMSDESLSQEQWEWFLGL